MDAEIGTFAALAVLMIGLFAWLRQDIRKLSAKMDVLREDLSARTDALRADLSALRERMAHIEGLLEGLREAITRRTA